MSNEGRIMSAMNKPTVHGQAEKQDLKEKGELEQRTEDNMDKFKAQFNSFNEDEPILQKAKELLEAYGSSENVPEKELDFDKSNYDEARLLGMIKILEKK